MVRAQAPKGHGVRWEWIGEERPDLIGLAGTVVDFSLCLHFN